MMRGRRARLTGILLLLAGAGLALLAWSQTWFDVVLVEGSGASAEALVVGGAVASPALAALGLAGLALAGALAIAGPVIRVALGVLAVVLGGCVVLAAALALGDPVAASGPAVTQATGVTGAGPVRDLVDTVAVSGWPAVAIAGGVVLAAGGILTLVTGRTWPSASRRYGATAPERADGAPAGDAGGAASARPRDRAIDDWDELSRGDDPTA